MMHIKPLEAMPHNKWRHNRAFGAGLATLRFARLCARRYGAPAPASKLTNQESLMNKIFVATVFILFCVSTYANDEKELRLKQEVMATVNRFLHSINTGDITLMAEVSRRDSMNYTRIQSNDGTFSTKARPQTSFLDPTKERGPKVTERIWDPVILVDDQIAAVWAPYDFHIDGKFSHCGIDLFNLIYDEGAWKIANSSWTVIRKGCAPSPLGSISE